MKKIDVRLTNEQVAAIQELAQANELNFSEQLRASIDKYLELAKQIQEGHFIVAFPSPKTDKRFYEVMHEIEALIVEYPDLDILDYVSLLNKGLQFDFAIKQIEKDKENLVLLSSHRDWMED
ncbi:MAG: hypothetical protein ACRC1P_10305 [Cellulosilyticaceae bacterium]